jgi:hypothetical protein
VLYDNYLDVSSNISHYILYTYVIYCMICVGGPHSANKKIVIDILKYINIIIRFGEYVSKILFPEK